MSILAPLLVSAALAAAPDPVLESPRDTLFVQGQMDGRIDAQEASVRGDFLRGLGWSVTLGPLGAVVAVRRSSAAPLPYPPDRQEAFRELGSEYRTGYEGTFEFLFPPRRREATLVGGMLGTLTFGYVLLQIFDLPGSQRFEGELPDEDPVMLRVPLHFSIPH